jgi:casein kinase II subunit alpha
MKKYPRSSRRKGALRTVARAYADVNLKQPKGYWDDSLEDVHWSGLDGLEVTKQLGKGKYGEVYEAIETRTGERKVAKIMRPVKEHRLRREIKILRHVAGGPNIVSLLDVARDPDTKTPCFIYELVEAAGFRDLQAAVTDVDVRCYLYQLLQVGPEAGDDVARAHGRCHRGGGQCFTARVTPSCGCRGGAAWGPLPLEQRTHVDGGSRL